MISPDGDVLFSNDAAQRILALPPDQIDGQPVERIFPTLDLLTWPDSTSPSLQGKPQTPPGGRFPTSVPTENTSVWGTVSLF